MAPIRSERVKPGAFIDGLQSLSEGELKDVLRVAQRLLKSKVAESRAATGAGRQKRFWDRPLTLDWGTLGLPRVQFPRREGDGTQEVDWRVFEFLKGTGRHDAPVDWEVFELLTAKRDKQEEVDWDVLGLLAPEEENEINFNVVDWSGDRLPHLGLPCALPQRRPGRPGRVRADRHGRQNRAIEPRRRRGPVPEVAADPEVAKVLAATLRRTPAPIRRAVRPAAAMSPWAMSRAAPRIQQPCGGGR